MHVLIFIVEISTCYFMGHSSPYSVELYLPCYACT